IQEIDVNTNRAPIDEVSILAEETGMYGYFIKSFNYQGGEYGNAILSRFPISASSVIHLPNPITTDNTQTIGIVTVETKEGMKLRFASTHLNLVKQNRIAQVNKIVEISQQSNLPLIIAGDLNATPE